MKRKSYSVIIPNEVYPKPSHDEISAAYILADYFQTNITFVPRSTRSTLDYKIGNKYWEIKSPRGSGKYNIQHAMRSAVNQARNIIIDTRNSKMHFSKIIRDIKFNYSKMPKKIDRIVVITKGRKVLDIINK